MEKSPCHPFTSENSGQNDFDMRFSVGVFCLFVWFGGHPPSKNIFTTDFNFSWKNTYFSVYLAPS